MLYIHIPFCQQRCIYCDFYSTTHSRKFIDDYLEATSNEIRLRADDLPSRQLSTIYIGGGTPSLLTNDAICKLFTSIRKCFTISQDAEVTFEANPDDITEELLRTLISVGVNRISLGVQSFNDEQLTFLHRRHSAKQAVDAVRLINALGIRHISVDLIYGQPRQTPEMWLNDLRQALVLPIDHLSAYALTVEGETPLKRLLEKGTLAMPNDETTLQQYTMLCEEMRKHGFEHYEISNFCLPDGASRHNSGYWSNLPYLGIGPGAHSYDGTSRYSNPSNLQHYIKERGMLSRSVEILTDDERCNDFVFTSLRTNKGLHLPTLRTLFGCTRAENILKWARPHIANNHLYYSGENLILTEMGIFVSNDVMSDLMHL